MKKRNLVILILCQLISSTGAFVVIALGGIIGSELAENKTLATLPVSLMVVVTALTTVPASLFMKRVGRKKGSAIASLSAAAAVLLAAYALSLQSFLAFIVAGALFGINMAFTQQYRYAAAESVEPAFASRAISLVLVGAIGGALIGPELVTGLQHAVPEVEYLGTLIVVAALYAIQALLFVTLGPMRGEDDEAQSRLARSLAEITRQPVFLMAVFGGTASYGVMTFVMTATPLSMHVHDGYSLEVMTDVIRAHVLGMYVPSLFTGFLIERFGTVKVMSAGALALLAACAVGYQGKEVVHYWYALVLLGVGWNFLYVGGTAMLTYTYSMSERFKAQAVNEFCVFGTSAAGSFLAGTIIHLYGWYALVTIPIPLLVIVLVGLYGIRRNAMVSRAAATA